jgi:hypothetical protein
MILTCMLELETSAGQSRPPVEEQVAMQTIQRVHARHLRDDAPLQLPWRRYFMIKMFGWVADGSIRAAWSFPVLSGFARHFPRS